MTLAARADAIEPRAAESPWDGYEFGRGYAVLTLPFSSGHLLGLRVFPQNDFAPYVSVWHRPPDGEWSIYVDGPVLEAACPRYWSGATESTALAEVDVEWTGPETLEVSMAEPGLEWTLTASAPALLEMVNALHAALPRWTWRVGSIRRLREWVARRVLDMGEVRFAFVTANGQEAVLAAEETYIVDDSAAVLDGHDLGELVALDDPPTVGDVTLPRRPTLVFGEAFATVLDEDDYREVRDRVRSG